MTRDVVDLAVIGAGPAGIAAAARAAEAGRRVVLLDSAPRPGGQIWRHRSRAELPTIARRWLERLDASGAEVMTSVSVVDAEARRVGRGHAQGGGAEGDRSEGSEPGPGFRLRIDADTDVERGAAGSGPDVVFDLFANRVVLATGARELFLPFPGWTLPNVFGVGGAQALLESGASFEGRRVVIAGSGPLLLPVAASLRRAGARLVIVAEQAPASTVARFAAGLWRSPGRLVDAARLRAALGTTRYATGTWIERADGEDAVGEVTLTDGRRRWTERCDVLCTGFGLVPNTELAELLGCDVEGGRVRVDAWQRTSVPGVYCAGEPTGIAGAQAALLEGEIAAAHAVGAIASADSADAIPRARLGARDLLRACLRARDRELAFARRIDQAFAPRPELRSLAEADTILCRCEDVTFGMIDPGWSARQAKLYTRLGMGPCQGRVCGPACGFLFGHAEPRSRVPVWPVAVGGLGVERR